MELVIRNATIAGEPEVRDIGIEEGRIVQIADHIEVRGAEELQAEGFLVSPGFMDVHMHLDKALVLDRYDWSKREVQATHRMTCVAESNKMKRNFTVEDVRARAIRVAEMCLRNGTTTLRTHVDIDPIVGLTGMEGVLAAKEACRGWMEMQVSPYPVNDLVDSAEETDKLLRKALEMGGDLVGAVPEANPVGEESVDRTFALAKEYDLDIDFHTDQVHGPRPFVLPYIAEKAIAEGWQGRVMASHCFGLGYVTPEERRSAIQRCREAGVSICVTPYETIQERVIEPRAAGVNVTYMSDNIQDAWASFGNADMLMIALFVGRLGSWRTNQELDGILEMGTMGAARAIGLADEHGVAVGKRADLVILEAKSGHEAIVNQVRKLWVIKSGRVVARSGELLVKATESS